MAMVTLEKLEHDLQDIKTELRRISFIIEEDFELSESAKRELEEARKEPLSSYVEHKQVIQEFF